MRIMVIASRKGGAGKTTLASHLGVQAEAAGAGPIALLDLDDMQGLAKWWDARAADTPVLLRASGDLGQMLPALRERRAFRYLIIDTPPATSPIAAQAIAIADLVVVPVQPSPDDLRAIGGTVELVRAQRRRLIFIINRVKPRVRLTVEAAVALSQHAPVAPVQIADRTDYAAAKIDGRTAPELNPNGPAMREIADLWRYLAAQMEEVPA